MPVRKREAFLDPKKGLYLGTKHAKDHSTAQLFTRQPKPIYAPAGGVKGTYAVDLLFWNQFKKSNRKYEGLLTLVQVNTRQAYAKPFSSKTQITSLMRDLIEETGDIVVLRTDRGTEFTNHEFRALLEEYGIVHELMDAGKHGLLRRLDRFHRTFRTLTFRWFEISGTNNWIDHFEDILDNYNNHKHSSMFGKTPNTVDEDDMIRIDRAKASLVAAEVDQRGFAPGDMVRVWVPPTGKKTQASWSEKVYKIKERRAANTFWLENSDKVWTVHELQKVAVGTIEPKETRQRTANKAAAAADRAAVKADAAAVREHNLLTKIEKRNRRN
jgi:hypothetical protein